MKSRTDIRLVAKPKKPVLYCRIRSIPLTVSSTRLTISELLELLL